MRKTYIENNDLTKLDQYIDIFKDYKIQGEVVNTIDGFERVTTKAVFAKKCDPMFNASAMDGIAVNSEITLEATENNPITLKLNDDFVYVNTGNPIDSRFNSVIMIENVLVCDENTIKIIEPSYPWMNVRVKGEGVVEGEMVIPSNRVLRPFDIGAIYASGNDKIEVYKKIKVGIIPSGNEMTNDINELDEGKLMESNSKMFDCLVKENHGVSTIYPIVQDDFEKIKEAVLKAIDENDVVIINAGSSAGTKDYTVHVIEELGQVFAHGFAIKPGKPAILGIINNKPIIGIPGYPVSAFTVFDNFVKPLMNNMVGLEKKNRNKITAKLTRTIVSSLKNSEYIRVNVGLVNNEYVATPIGKGAAAIMSLVKADGILFIDKNSEGYNEGSYVEVELLRDKDEIDKNILVIGSHDLVVDIIGDKLPLSSAHVGSMGGIMALLRNEAHIAPIHLLDEETGIYNISYIKKYFKGQKMVLIKGVGRKQGIASRKDNTVNSIEEIASKHIKFANRQNGSGTRILFDYLLKKGNYSSEDIFGYQKEYSTHLAVGVAIENKTADAGICIKSVANIFDLNFVELASEEYDFLTTYENYQNDKIKQFIQILKQEDLKKQILDLKDYSIDHLGEVEIIQC